MTPIIPIVLYQGKRKWVKRDVYAYFGKKLPTSLRPFCPNFDYFLTDLQTLNDEQILELNKGLLINTLLMMKLGKPCFLIKKGFLLRTPAMINLQITVLELVERLAKGDSSEQADATIKIIDEPGGHYLLFNNTWKDGRRYYGCFLHIDLSADGKI